MLTKGRLKFIGLLVLMLITTNALGFLITELTPANTTARHVVDIVIPFTFGFAGVWLSVLIAEQNGWI